MEKSAVIDARLAVMWAVPEYYSALALDLSLQLGREILPPGALGRGKRQDHFR